MLHTRRSRSSTDATSLRFATKLALVVVVAATAMGCSPRKKTADSEVKDLLNHQCYAPSHRPSTTEKDNWIKKMIPAAQDAEKIYGVPAAAIAAMSARESGYGLTKLYKGAYNAYGFKWASSSAEGRPYWVLTCQPKEDGGNKYIKFNNAWDATLFVAKKLSSMSRYKWVTDRYVKERKSGVDIKKAVDNWVVGLADSGYNYDPPRYKQDIVKLINNYQSPSWAKSNSYNLYWISANTSPRSK